MDKTSSAFMVQGEDTAETIEELIDVLKDLELGPKNIRCDKNYVLFDDPKKLEFTYLTISVTKA